MLNEIFTLSLAGGMAVLFVWAFKKLPGEEWQILACVPGRKGADGIWNGMNFTYYVLSARTSWTKKVPRDRGQ